MRKALQFILILALCNCLMGCAAPVRTSSILMKAAAGTAVGTARSAVQTGVITGASTAVSAGKAAKYIAPKAASAAMLAL